MGNEEVKKKTELIDIGGQRSHDWKLTDGHNQEISTIKGL